MITDVSEESDSAVFRVQQSKTTIPYWLWQSPFTQSWWKQRTVKDEQSFCEFLGLRSGVVEVSVILVYGTPSLGSWHQTFRDNLTVLLLMIEITFWKSFTPSALVPHLAHPRVLKDILRVSWLVPQYVQSKVSDDVRGCIPSTEIRSWESIKPQLSTLSTQHLHCTVFALCTRRH